MLLQINVQNPDTERRRRLPPAPKYENMTPPTNLTRKSQGCQCRICNVSRTKLSQDHKAAIAQFMFSTSSPSHPTSSDPFLWQPRPSASSVRPGWARKSPTPAQGHSSGKLVKYDDESLPLHQTETNWCGIGKGTWGGKILFRHLLYSNKFNRVRLLIWSIKIVWLTMV